MHNLSFRRKKHVAALLDQLSSELPEAVQPKGVFTSQSFIGRHMPLSSSIVVGICPVTDARINILLKGGSMSLEMGASAPLPMDASKLVATSNNL